MSREKPADPGKGLPIKLPPWFLKDLRREKKASGWTLKEVGRRVAQVSKGNAPSSHQAMSDFFTNKVTTDVTLDAILQIFPKLVRPIVTAASAKEARLFREIAALRAAPVPTLTETADNYDEDPADLEDEADEEGADEEIETETAQPASPPRKRAR
jgi:transcriptional regulator with XRE-family HTH domain